MNSQFWTLAAFIAVGLAATTLELLARRRNSRLRTLPEVITSIMSRRIGRITILLCWIWAGWHFLAR